MISKKFLLAVILSFSITSAICQDVKKETETLQTKMDRFTSKTGAFSKLVDTKLPDLISNYSSAQTRIRKVVSGAQSIYFYQIEESGEYSNSTASIEYSDLLEVIKALNVLKVEGDKDATVNPDYLENKFTTVDGFQIGYYVSKSKIQWYIKLEKYGSKNTIFVKDFASVETAFSDAKVKIQELQK
jgi:hypothetical protein